MTVQNQGLQDDIAFMRNLAEDGRGSPRLGASIMVTAVLICETASAAIWLLLAAGLIGNALIVSGIYLLAALSSARSRGI